MTSPDAIPGRPPWHPPGTLPPGFTPFPQAAVEGSIGARLQAVAEQHGDRLALRGPAGERSYLELAELVRRRATALGERLAGSGPATPVGLLAGHDLAQVEALLAVVSAGHTVLVLDPVAPEGLNRALLHDAGAPLLLTDEHHEELARSLAGDREVMAIADLDDAAPEDLPLVDASVPAMLAYTSGTSGDPKAAVVPHRQLLHVVRGATDTLAIQPADRLPMLFPLSLAVAAYPALLPLLTGASLTSFDVRGEGFADLPGWLAAEEVSVAYLAPTVVKFLEGAVGETTFPRLRLVVLGGERVDRAAVALTRELFGAGLQVANGYGTTETGVLAFWFVDDDGADAEVAVPAGYPIPGMALQVVDDEGTPVPHGETGELTVRSPYLFSGYRGHPDLNAVVLKEDPGTGLPVYRTGDLARLRGDTALELVGRLDTQVKVRGRRVVLAEVEEVLLGLASVRDAAVVAGRDGAGHTVIAAHVVPVDPALTADSLRGELAEAAPGPMVPQTIVLHDALPQLPNGKLDRRALTHEDVRRPHLATEYAEPTDDLESALVGLWEEVLGLSPIGVDDDFFGLGGDSLLGAQMLVELETRRGQQVPMAALLEAATIRELAAVVVELDEGRRADSGLVTVQEGDPSRPVLYVTHDLLGSVFRYGNLAAALGSDQPVKGFESPALTGEAFPFTRIETLALRYATELQRAQPNGPYHLCGYSFGGILAFEMARHLRRTGAEVALLAVVDIGPGYRGLDYGRRRPPKGPWLDLPAPAEPGASRLTRLRRFASVVGRSPAEVGPYAVYNSRFRQRLLPLAWRRQIRRDGRVPPRHRLWYAHQTHWKLVGPSWAGSPYDGEIVLFWSEQTGSTDATMGWGPLGADVEIHRIAVDHERVMDRDQVHHLADPLRAVLDRT